MNFTIDVSQVNYKKPSASTLLARKRLVPRGEGVSGQGVGVASGSAVVEALGSSGGQAMLAEPAALVEGSVPFAFHRRFGHYILVSASGCEGETAFAVQQRWGDLMFVCVGFPVLRPTSTPTPRSAASGARGWRRRGALFSPPAHTRVSSPVSPGSDGFKQGRAKKI